MRDEKNLDTAESALETLRQILKHNGEETIDTNIRYLKSQLESARADSVKHATTASTQQVFIREVSVFHREALLPLIDVVKRILEQSPAHNEAMSKRLSEVKAFIQTVEDRSKYYESQALVERARQAALDEQKRLEDPSKL